MDRGSYAGIAVTFWRIADLKSFPADT